MLFRATVCAHGKIFLPLYRSWETAHDFDFFLNNFSFKFSIKD